MVTAVTVTIAMDMAAMAILITAAYRLPAEEIMGPAAPRWPEVR